MRPLFSRSFTLVEILAATAILSLLFTIMFGILQQTSKGWQAANRRVEASQVARLAMDQIASDLENCVAVAQSNVWLPGATKATNFAYGFVFSDRPGMNQSWLPSSINISMPNDYIFVVTPYNPSLCLGTGDLCEVGYIPIFVASQTGYSTMRAGRYVLLRHLPLYQANSSKSSANQGSTNYQPTNDFYANSTAWETTPTGVSTTNRFPFVDNCIKFDIKFIYTNANGQTVTTNSWGRPTISNNTVGWAGNPVNVTGLPVAADIQMCVVDERTAERIWRVRGMTALDLPEKEGIPTNWSAVRPDLRSTLQESVLTLNRRVYFKNR